MSAGQLEYSKAANLFADKVLECIATPDPVSLLVERLHDGKMRVTSNTGYFCAIRVSQIRKGDNGLHVAGKDRRRTHESLCGSGKDVITD